MPWASTVVYLHHYLAEAARQCAGERCAADQFAQHRGLAGRHPVMARLSDRIGRKPILTGAAIGVLLLSWPLVELMRTGDVYYIFLGQFGFALLIGAYGAENPIAICEIFSRHVR